MRWSTIGDKIFGKIHENQEKLGMTKNFDICFLALIFTVFAKYQFLEGGLMSSLCPDPIS